MQAQRVILHTNKLGNLIEQPVLPANATVEAIFLVEESNAGHPGPAPSPRLKNSFSVQDDLISPLLRPEEWETSLDRTCKQIEGDENAFKAEID